jgi:hypothetical protein
MAELTIRPDERDEPLPALGDEPAVLCQPTF